jgi:hypothetical protein
MQTTLAWMPSAESNPTVVPTIILIFFGEDGLLVRQEDLGKRTVQEVTALLTDCADKGALWTSVDAYRALVLEQGVVPPELVDRVLPIPMRMKEQLFPIVPYLTDHAAAICRSVPLFFDAMSHMPVVDDQGHQHVFRTTIANTLSLRSRAEYQYNLVKAIRAQYRPADPSAKVLAFDWKAAEFALLVQIAGDALPVGDAYAPMAGSDIPRGDAKSIVIKRIYGCGDKKLHELHGQDMVTKVDQRLAANFPNTAFLLNWLKGQEIVQFEGFAIHLGNEPYVRPNHYVQTALQLCKWELIHRLVLADCYHLAAGDMHDSLIFHVRPDQVDVAARIIAEVRKPCFGRYHLKAEFGKLEDDWR